MKRDLLEEKTVEVIFGVVHDFLQVVLPARLTLELGLFDEIVHSSLHSMINRVVVPVLEVLVLLVAFHQRVEAIEVEELEKDIVVRLEADSGVHLDEGHLLLLDIQDYHLLQVHVRIHLLLTHPGCSRCCHPKSSPASKSNPAPKTLVSVPTPANTHLPHWSHRTW